MSDSTTLQRIHKLCTTVANSPAPASDGGFADGTIALAEEILEVLAAPVEAVPPIDLREALAAHAHVAWSHWTAYFLDVLEPLLDPRDGEDRHPTRGAEAALDAVRRWRRQIETPYADLTEAEKNSDREWGDKSAKVVGDWLEADLVRVVADHAWEDSADAAVEVDDEAQALRATRRAGYREAYATLAKALKEIDHG